MNQGTPFASRARRPESVSEIVVHESVTRSRATTEAVLRKRGLGVHYLVDEVGEVWDYCGGQDPRTLRYSHAGSHNGSSIGIEVVNPYEPRHMRAGGPWTRSIEAPWAHGGQYVLPTPAQAGALVELLCDLTARITGQGVPAQSLLTTPPITRHWVGLYSSAHGERMVMGLLPHGAGDKRCPGIWAHHYAAHADGAWPVLYCYLRIELGLPVEAAYQRAVELATGCGHAGPVVGAS